MDKQAIRNQIWQTMEEKNITDFPRPCYGRIPNFKGSRVASEKIKDLSEFKEAKCVFCAPDMVLKRIREIVLAEDKILAVALPHIKDIVEIHERKNVFDATKIKGFSKYGKPLKTEIDLFVQGSVAVDRKGNRLGKGRGYGDKEYFLLKDKGLLIDNIKAVTIVHHLQIVGDLSHLMGEYDVKVDYIITDEGIISI